MRVSAKQAFSTPSQRQKPSLHFTTVPNETRPISIQPDFMKLLDKCLFTQVNAYIETNNLLSQYQYGFRKTYQLLTHLNLTDQLYENMDKNQVSVVVVVTLDLQKAFDSIDRQLLINKLKWYGIDCKVINSLLCNRGQFVEVNGKSSRTKLTTRGIQQGAGSSSILFSMFINDLPLCVKNSKILLFADDNTIFNSSKLEDINALKASIEDD